MSENKHSTDIGACLAFKVSAHTEARRRRKRRRRRFNVGGVCVLNNPPAWPGCSSLRASDFTKSPSRWCRPADLCSGENRLWSRSTISRGADSSLMQT